MKKWKKNIMAAAVLLVVCAGIYVNWLYTNSQDVADLTDKLDSETVLSENGIIMDGNVENMDTNSGTDYFAAVRLSRQEARDSAVNLLQEAMAYGDANQQQCPTANSPHYGSVYRNSGFIYPLKYCSHDVILS